MVTLATRFWGVSSSRKADTIASRRDAKSFPLVCSLTSGMFTPSNELVPNRELRIAGSDDLPTHKNISIPLSNKKIPLLAKRSTVRLRTCGSSIRSCPATISSPSEEGAALDGRPAPGLISCNENMRGCTKCFVSLTPIPVRRCMACTRSSGWTSVPPRNATFFINANVYNGSIFKLSGMGLFSFSAPPCGCCCECMGGGAAYPDTVRGLSPSLLARTSSTHACCNLFLALSRLVLRPISNACFASRVVTTSASTEPITSDTKELTGMAWVTTRMRRSPSLLVYSSALWTVTSDDVTLGSSCTRSNANTESELQFGNARRSVPRTKKFP
mmetsp:Transcript_16332/g.29627  ORF Transcript_16332/g.29627 Transcript_16332/m.29627 type:complete len:329 (+) Transcript_16332:805-1791(+)